MVGVEFAYAVWWKILELVLSRITLISRGVGHVDVAY